MSVNFKIIKPTGVFDRVQADELRQQVSEILANGNNIVLLDMADVNSIDSSGLGALILILKMLRVAGGDLYLYALAEPVRELLSVTQMDRLFENSIAPTLLGSAKLPELRD